MGVVFLAQDLRHPRRVALKVLDPDVGARVGTERFLREVHIAAGLTHPHILPLHDSGEAGGLLYYVMPYVEGPSLRERLSAEGQLPIDESVRIAMEIADSLDYAHRQGVIHRDIKPENVLFLDGHAMVCDFGIARALHEAGDTHLTRTGVGVGTPGYMSPEQIAGSAALDGRTDQYSVACLLYEMIAGRPPFEGATAESLVHQHVTAAPRRLSEVRSGVSPGVSAVVQRALAKSPAERFGTAREFADALARGERASAAATIPWPALASRRIRPRRIAIAAGAVVLVGLAAGFLLLRSRRATTPPTRKDWILVADFTGPADDPELAAATRGLVGAALDQSQILATVPSDHVRAALQSAGRPDTTRITTQVALELAYRRSVRAVVEGEVHRLGEGFSIVLRVLDADDGKTILTVNEVAKNRQALIGAVERAARELRLQLGERRDAVQATRPLLMVTTPSYEAFRKYWAGVDRLEHQDHVRSVELLREAIRLDPGFAVARGAMSYPLQNLGESDSARATLVEALRRPDRLDDLWRLLFDGTLHGFSGDFSGAIAMHEEIVRRYPTFYPAYINLGAWLVESGRAQEAITYLDRAATLSPLGPTPIITMHQVIALTALGRLDRAAQLARRLPPEPSGRYFPLGIASVGSRWAEAESLAADLWRDPTVARPDAFWSLRVAAGAAAARGRLGAADSLLRVCEPGDPESVRRARQLLAVAIGAGVPHPRPLARTDTLVASLITYGLSAAAAGDTSGAERALRRVLRHPESVLREHGEAPRLLQAWVAYSRGHWRECVDLLSDIARRGDQHNVRWPPAGLRAPRWLVAQAYERLGQPDSAAAYYELAVSPLGDAPFGNASYTERGLVSSLGHRKLVMLYAQMGRVDAARRQWNTLRVECDEPDERMRALLAEARRALSGAERRTGS